MTILFLAALSHSSLAADLVIDGTSVTLSGTVTYDAVRVVNGGRIEVADYDGSAGSGMLVLIDSSITIDRTS